MQEGQATSTPRQRPVIAFMLWNSTAGFQLRAGESIPVQLAFPLNFLSNQGRPICGALLAGLLVPIPSELTVSVELTVTG